jgi:hypothetical protein
VLFEPVRKTQEARYFRIIRGKDGKELYEACSPAYPGPKIETTLEDLAKNGKASQVRGRLVNEKGAAPFVRRFSLGSLSADKGCLWRA